LPPGWVGASGDDLFDFIRGVSYKKDEASQVHFEGSIAILRAGNLQQGGLELNDLVYVPESRVRDEQLVRAGDLVLAMSSGSASVVGKVSFVDRDYDALSYGAFCGLLRPRAAELVEWLRYFFQTAGYRKLISSYAAGININNLRSEHLLSLVIPTPGVDEQRRVANVVSGLRARSRAVREALESIPPLLEQFRRSVLAAAFRGDLTADWRAQNPDAEPASDLLDRIDTQRRTIGNRTGSTLRVNIGNRTGSTLRVNNDPQSSEWFGSVQKFGWRFARLDTLVDPLRGIPYGIVQTGAPHPSGVPTVRCGDIKEFWIDPSVLKKVDPAIESKYPRTRLAGGEVLLAIRGTVGAPAVATSEMAGMNISREVAMIPVLPGIDARFLMYLLASPDAQQQILGQVKGVAQSGINLADLRGLTVPVPSIREQLEIVGRVQKLMSFVDTSVERHAAVVRELDILEQSILSKAFRGELVPQDPNDEPASMLLERIRAERESAGGTKRRGRRAAGAAT
jgi:type I restriction enzyme S subunit